MATGTVSPPTANPKTRSRSASSKASTTKSESFRDEPTDCATRNISALRFSPACFRRYDPPKSPTRFPEDPCFLANGGLVLFGTDVGFTNVYDTSLEFELMHRALSEREVLASPTTKPASYFKAAKKGR